MDLQRKHCVSVLVSLLWLFGHYQQQTAVSASLLDFPQPFLTVDNEAKVLRLNCTPPPEEGKLWDKVYKILIKVQLDRENTNKSVAVLQLGEPGKLLENFLGDIDSDSSGLAVTMAFEKQHGNYYCDIEHSRPTTDKPSVTSTHSRKVYVDSDGVHGSPVAFAQLDKTDRVQVVWHHPQGLVFSEASVYRYYLNDAGSVASERQTLYNFFNDKVPDQMLKHSAGVLLASVGDHDSNYTITIYVTANAIPSHTTKYTCYVPYKGCYGDNEDKCSCGSHTAKPDLQSKLNTARAVAIVLGILLFIVIVFLIVCFVLARRGNLIMYKLLHIKTKEPRKKLQGINKNDCSTKRLLPEQASGSEGQTNSCHLRPKPGPSNDGSCAGQCPSQLSETNQAGDNEQDPPELVQQRSSDNEFDADIQSRREADTANSRNHQAQVHADTANSGTSTSPTTVANVNNTPEDASRNAPATTETPGGASSNASPASSTEVRQPMGEEAIGLGRLEEDNQETGDSRSQGENNQTPRHRSVQESSRRNTDQSLESGLGQGIDGIGSGAATPPLVGSHRNLIPRGNNVLEDNDITVNSTKK